MSRLGEEEGKGSERRSGPSPDRSPHPARQQNYPDDVRGRGHKASGVGGDKRPGTPEKRFQRATLKTIAQGFLDVVASLRVCKPSKTLGILDAVTMVAEENGKPVKNGSLKKSHSSQGNDVVKKAVFITAV
ncbi:hypothetical protein HPB50_010752 [Hyalomma asiaticum]|uniref:Uncharacterized protein n=1 Tax=Hyalomma asiaticum TaxID=266040 RepID=A0ACB7T789_HYAAI|nr:hypothetical protein HPB50_010752 [Hyalomma asiaticum]